jgi:pilus assembly protein CpaB
MKSKTMILMVVAVGCGLVASFLTSRLLAERNNNAGPVMEKYLVAKKNLQIGTVIKEPEKFFVEKDFAESSAPRKGFKSFEEIRNLKLSKPVSEDAPLTKDDLLDTNATTFTVQIPTGHEAVGIRVNPELIAGGFVAPMDKVDVIWTFNKGGDSQSQIILQNMLVLATDTEDGRPDDKRAKLASTVTLAAKPDEAQKLSLAAHQGELRLSLRKLGDDTQLVVRPTKLADLLKGNQPQPTESTDEENPTISKPKDPKIETPTPAPDPVKEPETFVQTIQNGESRTVVKHQSDGNVSVEKTDPVNISPKVPLKKETPTKPDSEKKGDEGK